MKKDSHLGKRITRALFIVVSTITLTLVGSTAFAGTEFGGEVGAGAGGGGAPKPNTSGGSSRGGGSNTPTPTNNVYATFTEKGDGAMNCASSAIGYRISYRSTTEYFPSNSDLRSFIQQSYYADSLPDYVVGGGISCIYPPSHRDVTVRVVLDADIEIKKVKPNTEVLSTASATTRWGKGERTLAAAYASDSAVAEVSTSISEFGRYQLDGTARAVFVTIRTYSASTDQFGGKYEDEVVSTGNIFNADVAKAQGQLTCEGWSNSWTGNWSFTATDCAPTQPTDAPAYECVPDGDRPALTINGQEVTKAVSSRDGEANSLAWDIRRPSGGFKANGVETTMFWRQANSLPWGEFDVQTPSEANFALTDSTTSKKQLLTSATSTPVLSGARDVVYARGYWSSGSSTGTTVRANWTFAGTMQSNSVRVTGVDSEGNWELKNTTVTVKTTAMCASPWATISFVRSIQGNPEG
jgi:hypothetical protein